jgi:BetR domain
LHLLQNKPTAQNRTKPAMPTLSSQDFLFQRIKEMLPTHESMVDTVSEILHVSSDSAYRRIRGETPLVLEEARQLCHHFHLSLDQLLDLKTGAVLFQNIRINNHQYSYEKYISGLLGLVKHVGSFFQKEIIYLTKDVPIIHNFYYSPLIAFRYFFWMKTILQHPDFANRGFTLDCIAPEMEALSRELARAYTLIPSVEIWNTECINSTISQVEFCKDSGHFSSDGDIKLIYDALEETVLHLRAQVENGVKFMPGEPPASTKSNFRFFYNRVVLGDNTILITTDRAQSVYLNYDVLNYMTTSDGDFCKQCHDDMRNLMRKATLISQTGEKQRNKFFSILLAKIEDRKRNL